jgi:hypothetical protein
MRRLYIAALTLFSSGCFTMTLPGPNGVHTVAPLGGTMIIRVYNYCSPLLRAEGDDHVITLRFGENKELVLPAVFAEGNQQKTVIFTATTAGGSFLGVMQTYFNPDYNAYVTRKQYIVGGQYNRIYDGYGRDACRQGG